MEFALSSKQLKTRFSEYLDLFVMALESPKFWLSPVGAFV